MPTYRVDSLHPDRLACLTCGQTVCAVTPAPDDPLGELSLEQAMHAWPDRAAELVDHDVDCTWRQLPPLADGRGVYIHMTEREGLE
jgi:hypothetical protein